MHKTVRNGPNGAGRGGSRPRWAAAVALLLALALGTASGQPVATDAARPATPAAPADSPALLGVDSPALLPVEMFYRHADLGAARLSPSGKRLAVSVNQAGRVALAVFDLAQVCHFTAKPSIKSTT